MRLSREIKSIYLAVFSKSNHMPPKRDRSPSGRGAAASKEKLFDTITADQKNGVARLVASLALQYHSRKEILEASVVSKAVKDFLGADVRIRLETDVRPL